jgi:hypothetical protein
MPKTRRLPLTFWAAVAFLGIAAVTGYIWWAFAFLDDLAANFIADAIAIAITITAVEWIVRRQAQERMRPRTEDVLYWMGLDFRLFTSSILFDYATTHISEIRPIPRDALELIDLWLDHQDATDEPSRTIEGEWLPILLREAIDFESNLRRTRERDLDVLEPDLIAAIDKLGWHVGQAVQTLAHVRSGIGDPVGAEALALGTLMQGVKTFAEVFRRYEPGWFKILDLSVNGCMASREHIVRARRGELQAR